MSDEGEFATAEKLALKLRDKINYNASVSSIYTYKLLESAAFECRKTSIGRKFRVATGQLIHLEYQNMKALHFA
jgi:hypothetical protein